MASGVAELEEVRLSPRFVAKLVEGTGQGLLVRAVEETRRRAFFIWQEHPWMSERENWLAAEQSLLRPVQSDALKFEAATQTHWEEEGQDNLKEASHGAPIVAAFAESVSLAGCVSVTSGQISRSDRVGSVEMSEELMGWASDSLECPRASVTPGRPETGFDLAIAGFTRDLQSFGKGFSAHTSRTENTERVSVSKAFSGMACVPAPCREEKTAVQGRFHVVADFADRLEVPASEELCPAVARMCRMQQPRQEDFMASPCWKALQGDSKTVLWGLPQRLENSVPSAEDQHTDTGYQTERVRRSTCVPRLALDRAHAKSSTSDGGQGSARSDTQSGLGMRRWPGSNVEVPPLPAPPENHPLLTPRTGAGRVRPVKVPKLALAPQKSWPRGLQARNVGQEFLISTPHLPGEVQGREGAQIRGPQAVPRSGSRSLSPSPSSFSDGSLDSVDISDWERVASLQTTASGVQEADLTRRSGRFSSERSGSARSDFSVCGLYGCGDKAESQVLRKVIRDLEERLQAQSQELEALKAKIGTALATQTVGAPL
ncbi:unnamed protein product [Symbiodinium sp. CCMP2456]|nr:unnamed protein product [Symbiodinium sp. CCMP2456]